MKRILQYSSHVNLFLQFAGAEGAGFLSQLIGNDEAVLRDEKREAALQGCEAPLTIVRVGKLIDGPGGSSEIQVAQVNSGHLHLSSTQCKGCQSSNNQESLIFQTPHISFRVAL